MQRRAEAAAAAVGYSQHWGNHDAVGFRLLGDSCTRGCLACGVPAGPAPPKPDMREPHRIAETVGRLGLRHVVLSAVHRDDLRDEGAGHIGRTICEIKRRSPDTIVEAHIPDFIRSEVLRKVVSARPDVVAHHLGAVPRLAPLVRDRKYHYGRSLGLLNCVKEMSDGLVPTKSSLQVGVGERWGEVLGAMRHLRRASVDELAISQYIRTSARQPPISEFVHPEMFEFYERAAYQLGFSRVFSKPLARKHYF